MKLPNITMPSKQANMRSPRPPSSEAKKPTKKSFLDVDGGSIATISQVLKDLDCFVLDNSLRESTVGQIKGHTLNDKFEILKQVKKCNFKSVIVACFGSNKRVEDNFLADLKRKIEKDTNEEYSELDMYVFSDAYELPAGKLPDTPTMEAEPIPVGLLKMAELGFYNPVLEIDICDPIVIRDGLTKLMELLKLRLEYLRRESKNAEIKWFVNFRDFPSQCKIVRRMCMRWLRNCTRKCRIIYR